MADNNDQSVSEVLKLLQGGKQSTSTVNSNSFSKGMLKDYNDTFVGEGLYTHARNGVNNSHDGQVGVIGNEPSNLHCVTLPGILIGCIHLSDDQWAVFTTDDADGSEIGIFDESACTYTKVVRDSCLNFRTTHLITGTYRKRYDCERIVYWDDGLNPTRSMDIDKVPWIQDCTTTNNCITCEDTTALDCEKIRIAPLIKHPCISIQKGLLPGTMPNGSFQACIAYTVNQVKVTDYIGLSQVQGLFSHENVSSSLIITIEDIDKTFDEFELVILANVNAQTVAKKIGNYSTSQGTIYLDRWSNEFVNVSVSDVVFRSEPIEKTDAMYPTNNYLLRVGTYSKFKFNYQPIANNIRSKWVAVEYPANYYINGGNNTGYMRDEVYAFFIRWVYTTGEFSESYHIPGRVDQPGDRDNFTGDDAYETYISPTVTRERWQVENTATIEPTPVFSPAYLRGGKIVGRGDMAYWQSTELYPDNRPDIWGDLCGQNIRHHKMPDETRDSSTTNRLSIFNNDGSTITILGVQFENIQPPVDNDGNPIPGIVGYEILRGSREGNKSVIAKGLFNNMRRFDTGNPSSKGLFQNYPYNDLRTDPYLTAQGYQKDIFSFHSPDTTFSNPYLNTAEIKLYQEFNGMSNGYFEIPYKHPKFKLPTQGLAAFANIVGLLDAVADFATAGAVALAAAGNSISTFPYSIQFTGSEDFPVGFSIESIDSPPPMPTGGGDVSGEALVIQNKIFYAASMANWVATTAAVISLSVSLARAKKQKVFEVLYHLVKKRQYAVQYNSHGFYNKYKFISQGNRRRKVINSIYSGNSLQQLDGTYLIQNINRSKTVVVQIPDIKPIPDPITIDQSRFTIGSVVYNSDGANTNFGPTITGQNINKGGTISSYYGALKIPNASQYGQLESIKQLPVSTCITPTEQTTSNILFGGDIYIGRFTEKNTMPFFTTWLMGEPDEFQFNYQLYYNIPNPKYWINNEDYRAPDIINPDSYFTNFRSLDSEIDDNFSIYGCFYLFNSGVKDFFVESEVNVAYRDWEDDIPRRHYDSQRFADLSLMFRSDIATSGNYYKYDYNLSISKLFNSHISWGELLPRDYDPIVAATCYTYRPNRVIYSLPQQSGSKKDSWRIFLTNNYQDFPSRVSCIKPINKTGSLFMMAYQSPMMFMGVEELKVDGSGAKITIGDGGLFQQPMQSVVNVDESFEYASNQGRYCSINTVHGVFWVSQNQGKVFLYANQIEEISASGGMRWWFAKYMPSELLKKFPIYALYDNPVKGVGMQMMYDNTNDIIYITKKDYLPLSEDLYLDAAKEQFYIGQTPIPLTDTNYFRPASWTLSYDCKTKTWISFHDWIPSFLIPGRNHFMSVDLDSIWKHNIRCDSYCNFYGVDYPFEVEFVSATGQSVTSMRSVEYLLEVYNIYNDCRDKFHVLEENFDQAIIYNSEQISGVLQLNIEAKNNPVDLLSYPRINASPDYIDINFSKKEQKYRFNQFWDITNDRAEFTGPAAYRPMFNTEPNGYIYPINPQYVNYNKAPLERKKFRHNVNRVFLRKVKSGNNKFLFKISNQKLLQSPR